MAEINLEDILDNDYQITSNVIFKKNHIIQKGVLSEYQLIGSTKIAMQKKVKENWDNRKYTWIELVNDYNDRILRGTIGLHGRGLKVYKDICIKDKRIKNKKDKEKLEYE